MLFRSNFLERHDLHVHVPAGAIPKDGPSAGVTLATAILSAVRKEAVRGDVGVTGEVTLNRPVLPLGGGRGKTLAARRYGLQTFILPARCPPHPERSRVIGGVSRLREILSISSM